MLLIHVFFAKYCHCINHDNLIVQGTLMKGQTRNVYPLFMWPVIVVSAFKIHVWNYSALVCDLPFLHLT